MTLTLLIGLTTDKLDFIELVGEATRIPICIQQIKEVFGKDPSRTLNSTDCISRGCALQAAMLSPNFHVDNFVIEEYNTQPISISYKFGGTDKVVTKEIFKVGSSFPSTKSVTFDNKVGNVALMVHYSDGAGLMQGLPTQIAQYEISEGKVDENTEKYSFSMRVSNNIHNVACLEEAEFIQSWTEIEKIPVKIAPSQPPPATPLATEEKKEGEKPAEGETTPATEPKPEEEKKPEPVPQPEQ